MIGRQLLHYKILQRLGSGGMGDVYAAEDLKLGRIVALKMLPKNRAIDAERFHHEARLLAALSHPNIVTLFAIEEDEGRRFLVMERVEGASLDRHIPEQGMDVGRLLDLAIPLTEATAAAHEKGIVHRDLKPGNIMVDAENRLKILDFGLAQPITEATEPDDEITVTTREISNASQGGSKVSGTVPYMAPEALKGYTGDHRLDIFSLGVILYQMAAGHRPFVGDTTLDVLAAIIKDDPAPLRAVRRDLPDGFEDIVFRCLAKEPDERYETTDELLTDLERLRNGMELSSLDARLSGLFAQPPHSVKTFRRLVGAAALVATAVIGYTIFDDDDISADNERRLIAVLPFENLGPPSDDYFALGITEEITGRLSSVRDIGVIARSSTTSLDDQSMSATEIGRALQADYVLLGSVRWDEGHDAKRRVRITPRLVKTADSTQVWSATYEKILEDIFAVQTQIAVEVTDQLNVTLFPTERRALESRSTTDFEAYRLYLEGQREAGEILRPDAGQWAVELLTRATEKDPGFVEAWAQLAWTHALLYHYGLDRTDARRLAAEAAIEQALQLDPASSEARLAKANVLYWTQRDYPAALRELGLARRSTPNDHRIIEAEGFILRRLGRFEESIERLQDASELDPLGADLKREIATSLYLMRRFDESVAMFDEALRLSEDGVQERLYKARAQWSSGRPDLAGETLAELPEGLSSPIVRWFRALQHLYDGKPQNALESVRSQRGVFFQWTSTDAPFDLLEGELLVALGRDQEAEQAYRRALDAVEQRLAATPDGPRLLAARGLILARLGRTEDGLRDGWRSVELKPLEADAIDGAAHRLHLAKILTVAGEHSSALDEIELLLSIPSHLSPALLRLDPLWDPLRDDPRFRRLVDGAP